MEIIATLWATPASRSVSSPMPKVCTEPKASSSAYQIIVCTSTVRSGWRVPPVATMTIDARSAPNEKLATSQPRPVASAR